MESKGSVPARAQAKPAAEFEGEISGSDIVLFHSTANEVEDHQFTKTDPRSVFLLALVAGAGAVLAIATAHWLMVQSIGVGLIPTPPALQEYVR